MERVSLELSTELLARVDEARGMVPRNAWIRHAIEWEIANPSPPQRAVLPDPARSNAQATVSPRPKGER